MEHPDIETLVCHYDGELPPGQRSAIDLHLRGCAPCRLEYHRLGGGLETNAEAIPAQNLKSASPILAGILEGIHRWRRQQSQPDRSGEAVKRRVESVMAPYLGAAAASQVLQSVSGNGENLLSVIEPQLTLFLGRRAASELVRSIIDNAIVRTS